MRRAVHKIPGDHLPARYSERARLSLNLRAQHYKAYLSPEQNLFKLFRRFPSDFLCENDPAKLCVRVVTPAFSAQYNITTTGCARSLCEALAEATEKIAADTTCPMSGGGTRVTGFALCDGTGRVLTQDFVSKAGGQTIIVRPVTCA